MLEYKSRDLIKTEEKIHIKKHLAKGEEESHTHDFIEFEYIWCGSGHQVINGVTHYVERGDLLFFNFGDVHSFAPQKELGIVDFLINPDFFGKELVDSENALDILTLTSFMDFKGMTDEILPKVKFIGRELAEIETLIQYALDEFSFKSSGYMTALKGYVNILLTRTFRAVKSKDKINFYGDINKITPEILKYIEENYKKKITLRELASSSFYNPSYFSRIFKECFGKTLTEYINEKRLNAAIKLISETNESIEHIIYQVGYSDRKQFYKSFKGFTGMTPDGYRTKSKNSLQL